MTFPHEAAKAAYEAAQDSAADGWYAAPSIGWDEQDNLARNAWGRIAQAAIGHAADELAKLREALEATLADWREDAVYRVTDTRDEMNEHCGVTACADTLAGILAAHQTPGTQPGQQETNQEGTK